jgi:hypothetical protein
MRRAPTGTTLLAILAALLATVPACKRHQTGAKPVEQGTPSPRFSTVVIISDPRAAGQLLSGFHSVEEGSWRWTERQFALNLALPRNAQQRGAALFLRLTVPPATIERLNRITLSASVGGGALEPETYTAPGNYVYRRPVARNLLTTDPVRIDFSLDKAIPPTAPDLRELGVVVLAIGLEPR